MRPIVFLDLMLPLVFLLLAGAISRRNLQIDTKSLSRLTLYLLSPALVFQALATTNAAGDELGKLAAGTALVVLGLSLLVKLIGRLRGWSNRLTGAVQLGSAFTNVGNYMLPIIASLFGQAGTERVAIIIVTHQVLMCSLAVYFAANGCMSVRRALEAVLRMPTIHMAVLACILRAQNISLPPFLLGPISLLAQSALPISLVLLGAQLADVTFSRRLGLLCCGSLIKLVASPAWAALLGSWLGVSQLGRSVLVLAAAAPTAVVTTMLAIEFDTEPDLVSSLTLCTTLLSLLTVPLWVGYLRSV